MAEDEIAGWFARWRRRAMTRAQARLVEQAAAVSAPKQPRLADIEHVVILIQENRSFDHYFGTLSGVRGFSDPAALQAATVQAATVQAATVQAATVQAAGGGRRTVFDQVGYRPGKGPDPAGYLQPFRLLSDPPQRDGQSTNDISHTWPTQHRSWNDGALDAFVTAHLAANGPENGPLTMGYFTRQDLPLFYALADAFTVCDRYHASVIGPTDPNRLMAMSATIDPGGIAGGPVLETYADRLAEWGKLRWETMPERLTEAGVSWRIYNNPLSALALSPLPYFKAYADLDSIKRLDLVARAFTPLYPDHFRDDVAAGTLPSVSWIMPPLAQCEHPAAPPEYGEHLVQEILQALVANPDVWARTVLFVVHDENGGFFDHVPPPVAPAGTDGEWLTAATLPAAAGGIRGPVGLGFRVPCLVLSPFSRGGFLCPDVFDHTSLLRFIETRFGVEVPNLSAWRRSVTGDLTSALALGKPPVIGVPQLPTASLGDLVTAERAVLSALRGAFDVGSPYPVPAVNSMPAQEPGPPRPPVPG